MREFEERTRIIAERLDVEEIFRARETELLREGGRSDESMNAFHAFFVCD